MKILLLLAFIVTANFSFSQQSYILFLKDKSAVRENIDWSTHFSERSLVRRANKNVVFNQRDFPVTEEYIQRLTEFGNVVKISKWLNAVVYSTNMTHHVIQSKFPFVERIKLIEKFNHSSIVKNVQNGEKTLDYGEASEQVLQLNLDCLHDLGYTGNGIYLAVIDAGFPEMSNISYFDSLFAQGRILDTYDFVNNTINVFGNSSHGTMVTSCIVGEKHSGQKYIGTAKDVDIALYRSEFAPTESIIEEFDLVLALERCDSVGVDIANISLGYVDFDNPLDDHSYADRNGNSTIAAIGVNVAASKGIAVIVAAGNGGPAKISTPCDADSCLCVGAANFLGGIANFSSVGPSSDGQVKPDVIARGLDASVINVSDNIEQANGTSFASPIMCGATACLIQAHPSMSVMQIFGAIRFSADQFNSPDSLRGYGLPDFCIANQYLIDLGVEEKKESILLIYPNPASNSITIENIPFQELDNITLILYNILGEMVFMKKVEGNSMTCDTSTFANGIYTLEIKGSITNSIKRQISIAH